MSKSSLEAAAEAAAKVNAMLIAKGKLKLTASQLKPKIVNNFQGSRTKTAADVITAEVDINDAPPSARNLLTRGHMQDEICKISGAAISTRGRYMTPDERQSIVTPECRPLYLNVQASGYESIKIAVQRIQEIIDAEVLSSGIPKCATVGVVTYPSNCVNGAVNSNFQQNHVPSGAHFVQDKVFVGLEQAPADYPVRDKMLGPGGTFLQHIRTETGSTVTLRGKGSGFIEPTSGREAFEPLYIHLTHPKPDGLQAAKALAINLIETAHVEYAQWQQTQQSVLQPLTSIVLPQAAPMAYQNQVMMAPAVLPGTLPAGAGVVATGIQIPASVPAPGATLTAGLPNIMHASLPTLVSPVSVVSSVPVSVQALSPAVITYPTYVANTNPILARPAPPVLARTSSPAVSILGMVPTMSPAAAYTIARPRPPYHIQPVVYANVPPPHQPALTQPSLPAAMMTLAEPTAYPVPPRFTHPPPMLHADLAKHRYYSNVNATLGTSVNTAPSNCLQESNVNHPTEPAFSGGVGGMPAADVPDRDLMPPPMPQKPVFSAPSRAQTRESEDGNAARGRESPRKKLKGALRGLASIYGSDDSEDED